MDEIKTMMNDWLQHRRILEELLEQIDDEHLHFKPWDGAMSLSELALHVAASNEAFITVVKTGGELVIPDVPECTTMDDVRKNVRKFTKKTKATYESLTKANLEAESPIPHPKLQGKRKVLLTAVYEHEIHHKGQLYVYARMVGAESLPFFR
ncbi:DinB family protein [Virgibacillus sp. YIM 98842]|uniref:DinB family protein n=1 Tax=Virgibacillus sp. YIM 98842 TaxID=2663533 RepID=UPI0013DBD5B5|nr:DinB family protein [Virgibacillus sp. YIM 98842]